MIRTFRCKDTEGLFNREGSSRFRSIENSARRKLTMLNNSQSLQDLRVPPENRLEVLTGDRKGQHSIRVNDQWRICFVWRRGDAYDVEIADYH